MLRAESLALRIVLVRHAQAVVDPQRPAHDWELAAAAVEGILSLAAQLRALGIDGIMTSPERKAAATARIIAMELGLAVVDEPALREQGGEPMPWIESEQAFHAAVARHFAMPEEVVLGNESSDDAVKRLVTGIERACACYQFPVLVGHGRVMSGFMARVIDTRPIDIWKDLRMPDAFVIDLLRRTWTRIGGKETQ